MKRGDRPLVKLGDRVNNVLVGFLLLQEQGAVDPQRDIISNGRGGHGKHGTTTTPPTGAFAQAHDRALVLQWADRFERLLIAAERELAAVHKAPAGTTPAQDKTSDRKRDEDRAILRDEEGKDPTFVAFIYGRTTEGIRKLRQRAQRDPDTGERVPTRPLTAPAREQLAAHESADPNHH